MYLCVGKAIAHGALDLFSRLHVQTCSHSAKKGFNVLPKGTRDRADDADPTHPHQNGSLETRNLTGVPIRV